MGAEAALTHSSLLSPLENHHHSQSKAPSIQMLGGTFRELGILLPVENCDSAVGTSSLAAVNQMLEIIRNHLLYWDLSHMVCGRQ